MNMISFFVILFSSSNFVSYYVLLLIIPYTGLGPFRALKVQSKLVRLGGGVCSLKTVIIYLFY